MKIIIIFFSLILPLWNISQVSNDNLIACYDFEGNTSDAISGYDGTLLGNANVTSSFNTQLNDQDRLSIPGNILDQVSEFTISVKVKFNNFNTNSSSSGNCIFSAASSTDYNLLNLFYVKNQQPGGSATLSNMFYYLHNNIRYEFPNINLNPNEWYNVSLVREANNVKLYLDGVIQSPANGHSVPTFSSTIHPDGFIFGQDQDFLAGGYNINQCMNGSIDILKIHDIALDSQRISTLFTNFRECGQLNTSSIVNELNDLIIYPNPTSDYIYIDNSEHLNESVNYKIFSSLGIECAKGSIKENDKIDFSHLNPGVYFIYIQSAKAKKTIKVIKK